MLNSEIGRWIIDSVTLNSHTVTHFEGFESLQIDPDQIEVLPTGMIFDVLDAKGNHFQLIHDGQSYAASIDCDEDQISLILSRSDQAETVTIAASRPRAAAAIEFHESREVVWA